MYEEIGDLVARPRALVAADAGTFAEAIVPKTIGTRSCGNGRVVRVHQIEGILNCRARCVHDEAADRQIHEPAVRA